MTKNVLKHLSEWTETSSSFRRICALISCFNLVFSFSRAVTFIFEDPTVSIVQYKEAIPYQESTAPAARSSMTMQDVIYFLQTFLVSFLVPHSEGFVL
jgi:hypothetical protein